MDRVAAQTLRVLGIVALSIVIIVAALIFAIASMCGLWSATSTADQAAKLYIGVGCPVIFIGGIFLIAKLAKGIARSRRQSREESAAMDAAAASAPPQTRDFALEEEPLLHLRVAVDYSARDAILRAAVAMRGEPSTREQLGELLARVDHDRLPATDVDLVIRTGGEQRLSDFLLWECAYAELWFTDRLWPDVTERDLAAAVADYRRRDRRFGRISA